MTKHQLLGTLSEKGWLEHPPEILDSQLNYYINSEHSQSDWAPGHVKSLPYDIANFNQSPSTLEARIRTSLEELMTAYFPELVEIEVTVKPDKDHPAVQDIYVNCWVARDGVRFNLGKSISIKNGKVSNYMNLQGE